MRIKINGQTYTAVPGETILDVAQRNRIRIPTLCASTALPGMASCRLCMVEVKEGGNIREVAACSYPVTDKMEVKTNTRGIAARRKILLQLYQLMAPDSKEIRQLLDEYKVPALKRFTPKHDSQCVLCGLCARACKELGSNAITTINRGTAKKVSTFYGEPAAECIGCGACASVCPVGAIALTEKDGERKIWGKTFKLLACADCGTPFITQEALDHLRRKMSQTTAALPELLLCERCKTLRAATKVKNVARFLQAADS